MFRTVLIGTLALALAGASLAQGPKGGKRGGGPRGSAPESETAPPIPKTASEKRILEVLGAANKNGDLYANVPASDGRMLRILAEAVNAKVVVEFGTSTGLSGLWYSMALEKTGGKLITHELDAGRAATARKHFQQAGVDKIVTVVEGDAHVNLAKIKGPVDVVFIDAEKDGYVDYLNKMLPLVRPGGLILAHNSNMVADYMKEVTTRAELDTVVYTAGGGLAISVKKR
jgi:predicted O-methyltransferase YrrM